MCEEAPADKFLYGNAVDQKVCPLASLKMFINKTDPNASPRFLCRLTALIILL